MIYINVMPRNPMTVPPLELRDIKVLGTVYRGRLNRIEGCPAGW